MTPVLSSYWGLSINGKSQQHFALFDTFDIGFLSYRSVNHFPGSLSHSASLSLSVSLSLFLLSSFFLAGIQFHTWGSRMRGRSGLCQQRPAFFPFFCWYRKNEERERARVLSISPLHILVGTDCFSWVSVQLSDQETGVTRITTYHLTFY